MSFSAGALNSQKWMWHEDRVFPYRDYAPINVKPAGGKGGGRQGMGWGFDIFQKFAVKFPAYGQVIPVKCNQISPARAAMIALSNILRLDPRKAQ